MDLQWLKEEIEKEVRIISQAFGVAEKEGKTELEVLKNKALQESKTLEQFLKNILAKEEMELKYIKSVLTKEINLFQNKLIELKKKEKQDIIIELNTLRLKIKEMKPDYGKAVNENINRLQNMLQKIKKFEKKEKQKVIAELNRLKLKIKETKLDYGKAVNENITRLQNMLQRVKEFKKGEKQKIILDLNKLKPKEKKIKSDYKKKAIENLTTLQNKLQKVKRFKKKEKQKVIAELNRLRLKKEMVEHDYKKKAIKEINRLHDALQRVGEFGSEEKQKLIIELNTLRLKIKNKKIVPHAKKQAIEKINRLQSILPKIKSKVNEMRKLAEKAKVSTKKEEGILVKKIKEAHKKDTILFHKELKELNKVLNDLKEVEKTEVQKVKSELENDVKRVRTLLQKSKIKNKRLKKATYDHLSKIEDSLKIASVKETKKLKQTINQRVNSFEKSLNAFIAREKEQTLKLIHLSLAKLGEAEVKAKEEGKGLEKYVKKLFKKKKVKTEADLLKETAFKKLKTLERKQPTPDVFDDFTWVLKVFLSNYLGISYEYTHQELVNELTKKRVKHKDDIIRISEEIVRVNYEGGKLDQAHFKSMVEEVKRIIREV